MLKKGRDNSLVAFNNFVVTSESPRFWMILPETWTQNGFILLWFECDTGNSARFGNTTWWLAVKLILTPILTLLSPERVTDTAGINYSIKDNVKNEFGRSLLWTELYSPQAHVLKPYSQNLTMWLHLETGPLKRFTWRHMAELWSNMTGVLMKRGDGDTDNLEGRPCADTVRSPLWTKERGLRRNQHCNYLDLGFPASRIVKKGSSVD